MNTLSYLLIREFSSCLSQLKVFFHPNTPNLYNKSLLKNLDIIHTFRIVVLHSDDFASSFLSVAADQFSINGFYGEWVDHTDVDSIDGQFVCCLQGFEQGHTATNHSHLVAVTLTYHLQNKLTKSQEV